MKIYVKERKPKSSEEGGKFADDSVQARKPEEANEKKKSDKTIVKHCHSCGNPGHLVKDCRVKMAKNGEQVWPAKLKKDLREVECYNCHKKGHYSSNCPKNAMFCTERRVNHHGNSSLEKKQACAQPDVVKRGSVEGRVVDNILLDTGCSRTLVHQSLVPEEKIQEGSAVAIRCAHGDTVLYPLAKISLEVEGQPITVEAAVSNTLPMLGTDNPELPKLLRRESEGTELALAVTIQQKTERRGGKKKMMKKRM